jgi:hypothetical protein
MIVMTAVEPMDVSLYLPCTVSDGVVEMCRRQLNSAAQEPVHACSATSSPSQTSSASSVAFQIAYLSHAVASQDCTVKYRTMAASTLVHPWEV